MAQTRVNIAVAIGTAAALGGSWMGVTGADAAAAAAKAIAAEEAALADSAFATAGATPETAAATVVIRNLGSLPDLSSTLGAPPAIQLPPLPSVSLGSGGGVLPAGAAAAAGAPALVPAPPATAVVVSAPTVVAPIVAASAPKPVVKATKAS